MSKKLNKFEETRLLSSRAAEIASGDKPKIKIEEGKVLLSRDYVKVAQEEEKKGTLELDIYKKE